MASDLDSETTRKEVGLPPLLFTFTLDQIAGMLGITERELKMRHLYFQGLSSGKLMKHNIFCVNIAPPNLPAVWRVSQREFVRFCKQNGFRGFDMSSTWGAGS
jgi:hypothetical protein